PKPDKVTAPVEFAIFAVNKPGMLTVETVALESAVMINSLLLPAVKGRAILPSPPVTARAGVVNVELPANVAFPLIKTPLNDWMEVRVWSVVILKTVLGTAALISPVE